jgi:23S rRNA (adenine2503-C2)-methyltransferase
MSGTPPDLAELELPALEAELQAEGFEPYHARQLFRWIYKRGVIDVERMTDLSRALRGHRRHSQVRARAR